MKWKLRFPQTIAAGLALMLLSVLLADKLIGRPYAMLPKGCDIVPPAQSAKTIGILIEGTCPGMSDVPVTARQAIPGQSAMRVLREQRYSWIPPFTQPRDGGIQISQASGCGPEVLGYWDGRYLWLPRGPGTPWRGYAPASPETVEEALQGIYQLQNEIREETNTNRS